MEINYKVNSEIKANRVLLVTDEGEQKGIKTYQEAINLAREESLDLVQVSDGENGIPVCKILDYGKLKYRFNKKNKQNNHKQTTKEMKFNYNISEHDLEIKHKKIRGFIEKHCKIQYIVELKGREKSMVDEAFNRFVGHLDDFEEFASWKTPTIEYGNNRTRLVTTLIPK